MGLTDTDRASLYHWNNLAQVWRSAPPFGPPLAPSAEDLAWFEARIRLSPEAGALLLGVTPALASMNWPRATRLTAVDWSWRMLRNVWAFPEATVRAARTCADWRALPLPDACVDLVVGDGCYAVLPSLRECARLNEEIRRVLRQGGSYLLRCFIRPDTPEHLDAVFEELRDATPEGFDALRWRIALAVHGRSREGVTMHDVWAAWNERMRDHGKQEVCRALSDHDIAKIERWRNNPTRVTFPSPDELRAIAGPWFEVVECDVPEQQTKIQFPRVHMRAR